LNYNEIIQREKVRYIDVKYVDLLGRLRHVTLPLERLPAVMERGIGIDGSSLPGFKGHEASDMKLMIDTESAFLDPLFEEMTLSFLSSIHVVRGDRRFSDDPKYVLNKAVNAICSKTSARKAVFQPELEFYLFSAIDRDETDLSSFYSLEPIEDSRPYGSYHAALPGDHTANLRNRISSVLSDVGIKVKYHHHEGGAHSQVEIELNPEEAEKVADWIVISKYIIKGLALQENLIATFMPKPINGHPGSGLHLHQYLADENGRSLFAGSDSPDGLNDLARYYIGGLLAHIGSLTALTNPSTNSFRRLKTGFESPEKVDYSVADRTCAIRIPGYASKNEIRIEYRVPDATSNPFLAMAALLMAGLDGIERKLDPEDVKKSNPRIPCSLNEALEELRKDHDYLLKDDVFTESLLENWIEINGKEAADIESRVHPREFVYYFEV